MFWGPWHFCFYDLTPSDPSKGLKMGILPIFKVILASFHAKLWLKSIFIAIKTDLENPHFYPFRGVWGGQPIKAKVSGTSKYIIITLLNYMLIIEKLVFIQHLTHRALGTDNLSEFQPINSFSVVLKKTKKIVIRFSRGMGHFLEK